MHTHPGVCISFFSAGPRHGAGAPDGRTSPDLRTGLRKFPAATGDLRRNLPLHPLPEMGRARAFAHTSPTRKPIYYTPSRPAMQRKSRLRRDFSVKTCILCGRSAARKGKKRSRGGGLAQGENARVHGEVFCAEGGKKRSYSGKRRALSGLVHGRCLGAAGPERKNTPVAKGRKKRLHSGRRAPKLIPFPDRGYTSSAYFNYTSSLHVLQPLSSV